MTLKPIDEASPGTALPSRAGLGRTVAAGEGLKLCDARRRDHIPGRVTRVYGHDQSATIEYRFNAAGYRSEDYRSDAKFRICVIGESHAIGTGICFQETFGFRLKAMIAGVLDLNLNEVNLINLGFGGASADYCARTLYRQLPGISVDFVVCVVPPADRIEFRNGKVFNSFVVGSVDVNQLDKLPADLLGFLDYYSHEIGRFNRVKNMLLMQGLLRSRDIDYVLAAEKLPEPGESFDALDPFLAGLDADRVLRHQYFMQKADRAADGDHAGPRTHAAFAIRVFHQFGHLMRYRNRTHLADRIETESRRLMAEDADFRFCTKPS